MRQKPQATDGDDALFTVLPTDTRWYGVMLKGPELCSRCKQAIEA